MNFGKALGMVPGLMGGMGGGSSGGFNPRGMGASPFGQAMRGNQMLGGGMGAGPGAMAAGALLSDERSKDKITALEDELARTYAALGGKPATADVQPQAPDTSALDAAYRKPTASSYEYKDPGASGAGPGRFAGPMSDELKGIPGVVQPGADGMDRINEPRLTMANASEIGSLRRDVDTVAPEVAALRRELDALNGRISGGQSNPDGTF